MTNPENIAGQGFHTNPERISAGRQKGQKNRSTILREILALNAKDGEGEEYLIAQALIDKAKDGDVPAIKEFQDSMYGKITDTSFNINAETEAKDIPAEDMKAIAANLAKELQDRY